MEHTEFEAFVEPTQGQIAGSFEYLSPDKPYDTFMKDEGVPIYRTIGVHDVRELELADWDRLGIRGAFLQPLGTEEKWGLYVAEVAGGSSITAERHIYEEIFFVLEGHGTTEVWREGSAHVDRFEWQEGSLFSIPLNAWHRVINATNRRAIFIVGTTAPPVLNLYANREFIFENSYNFEERYAGNRKGHFEYREEVLREPVRGRAVQITNFIPDIIRADLKLDNERSPGYRRVEPHMACGLFYMFIAEHQIGRYAKAHAHNARAVLICIKGKGFTYTWPSSLGIHPWADGHGDSVQRQDYKTGGLVAAAPGGAHWYHAHFGIGSEPLRLLVFAGPFHMGGGVGARAPGTVAIHGNASIRDGGRSIDYDLEDPFIREEYERALREDGLESTMDASLYIGR